MKIEAVPASLVRASHLSSVCVSVTRSGAAAADRYRLAPDVVTWSDVAEFERLVSAARTAESVEDRLRLLESARVLYRSDLLDDCPFYGDSVHVEERREELRERVADLLMDLGDLYAERGDRAAAADALRRAQTISGRDLSGALAALPAMGAH